MVKKIKEQLYTGIPAGISIVVISGLLNFYLIPFPKTMLDYAGENRTGLFCVFISFFIGVTIFMNQKKVNAR